MAAVSGEPLPDNFFYEISEFEKQPSDEELPASYCTLHHSLGLPSAKRDNLFYLDDVSRHFTNAPC
eukprot:6182557-Pleurochrysis_carterae.AAC.4